MKKWILFIFLLIMTNIVKAQPMYTSVDKYEFSILSGMCLIGLGLGFEPYPLKSKIFYRHPEFVVPVSIGISFTIYGVISGIKKRKKEK